MNISTHKNNNVEILHLEGRFDAFEVEAVEHWLDDVVNQDNIIVLVNLQDVDFIDSTAISTLVQGTKMLRINKGDLILCGLQETVRIIFDLTRLDQVFYIYETEQDALDAITR